MSHRATNWAVQQRGLRPAVKVVLWHLCDRHKPDHGCFPSQEQLAFDAEVPRRTLNVYLNELERAGLIRRERRVDPTTRRRRSTRYLLALEDGFSSEPCAAAAHGNAPEPCAEIADSHVQNLHTNLVIEPVITTPPATRPLDEVEARCLEACGPGLCETGREATLGTQAVLEDWLQEGFELEADILPVISERTARERTCPVRTWDYFTEAIRAARRRRLARAAAEACAEKRMPGPEPRAPAPNAPERVDVVARMAAWINSDAYVPPSAVSNTMRDALLARGLVTKAALRRRQIY